MRLAPADGVPLTVRASAVVQDLHVEGQDATRATLVIEVGKAREQRSNERVAVDALAAELEGAGTGRDLGNSVAPIR